MILEVGAGGCIMVTPPAKGSQLEKVMNGEKIGGVTVSSLQLDRAKNQVIDFGSGCSVFKSGDKPEEVEYARYMVDAPYRNADGSIKMDVNGNVLYCHRVGDVMLDENGDPVVVADKPLKWPSASPDSILNRPDLPSPASQSYSNEAPKIQFTGMGGGLSRPCGRRHVDDITSMDAKSFNQLYDEITQEARRRIMGGKPIDIEDNPHVVASI